MTWLVALLCFFVGCLFGFFVFALLCEKITQEKRMSSYGLNLLVSFYSDKLHSVPLPRSTTEHHALFMCTQILSGQVRGEKAQRWLGFIQGLLWISEHYSIQDMRTHVRTALEA